MRLEDLLDCDHVTSILSGYGLPLARTFAEWSETVDMRLTLYRGHRRLEGLERVWEASPRPIPMILITVAARLDRQLEAALLSRAVYWGKYRPHPWPVRMAIGTLRATLDKPEHRRGVAEVRADLDRIIRRKNPRLSTKIPAMQTLCSFWLSTSRDDRFRYANQFLASGCVGVMSPEAETARVARAIREAVPYHVMVSELDRVAREGVNDGSSYLENLF